MLPVSLHGRRPSSPIREDCGVIAVYRPAAAAAELAHRGLFMLQHRGQEAAGIASIGPAGTMHFLKGRGLVAECLPTYEVKELPGELAIGHVRYSTVPADRTENIQPFIAQTPYGRLAIAHNGNLKNALSLKEELEADGALLSTSMDTELIVHLIARSRAPSFSEALRAAAARMEGAYSLTLLCDGHMYALRDPNGIRPLVLGTADGCQVVASETCALDALDVRYEREIEPGELVELGPAGIHSQPLLAPAREAPCVFELVYFARPDSEVFGQGVHRARLAMGSALARQDMARSNALPDIVVPIPDSGFPAAIGYARESGVPLEKAIIRSHYIGRTFILPDQDSRTHSLRLKLSVIRDAVKDRRVALVDDSIVRGNTSRLIVDMVREAGAREVWMRIASPPLRWPCYLGIDTPSHEELIANRHGENIDAIRDFIRADDLAYLSLEGLRAATQQHPFCFGCMTGEYPV